MCLHQILFESFLSVICDKSLKQKHVGSENFLLLKIRLTPTLMFHCTDFLWCLKTQSLEGNCFSQCRFRLNIIIGVAPIGWLSNNVFFTLQLQQPSRDSLPSCSSSSCETYPQRCCKKSEHRICQNTRPAIKIN